MGLETGNTIYDLNTTNPAGTDTRSEGDNHIRLIKSVVTATFLKGTLSARPSAGTAGRRYVATDTKQYFYDDGTSWVEISGVAVGEAISGDDTLVVADAGETKFVDTSAGDVTITLPAEATAGIGWWARLVKISDANDLILVDDAAAELDRASALDEVLTPYTDGTSWYVKHGNPGNVGFSAHKNGTNQTGVVPSTWTKVTFGTEVYDTGGIFASSTFTVPVSGKYWILSHVQLASGIPSGDNFTIAIYKNGSSYKKTFHESGQSYEEITGIISIVDEAAVGDTYEIYVLHNAAGNEALTGNAENTFFMCQRAG